MPQIALERATSYLTAEGPLPCFTREFPIFRPGGLPA
jgi:hypothetical protein